MRISVPRGTHVGAVHAQRNPLGPPQNRDEELASDEEWETDTESDTEQTPPQPQQRTRPVVERNGMGGMARIQNSGIHADFY